MIYNIHIFSQHFVFDSSTNIVTLCRYLYGEKRIKTKNIKIKCSTSLKRAGHVESKFDRLNFHEKSNIKSEKYHKIKF